MNSILSKSIRVLVACVLCVCICLSLTACTRNTRNIDEVDQICVSGALYESWMYVLADKEFVDEMVEIYNSISYEKTDALVDTDCIGGVLFFSFNNGSENVAKFIVDKNNNFYFEAGKQAYHIVSDFDFDYVNGLVKEYSDKTEDTIATPDEVN